MRQFFPARASSLDCVFVPGAFTVEGDEIVQNEGVGFKVSAAEGTGCFRIETDHHFARVLSATMTVESEKPIGLATQIKAMDKQGITIITRQAGKATKPPKGVTIHFLMVFATSNIANA